MSYAHKIVAALHMTQARPCVAQCHEGYWKFIQRQKWNCTSSLSQVCKDCFCTSVRACRWSETMGVSCAMATCLASRQRDSLSSSAHLSCLTLAHLRQAVSQLMLPPAALRPEMMRA